MKRAYVGAVRGTRSLLAATGLLAALERRQDRRSRYLRSLLAIYDAADLARLDLSWWSFGAMDAVEAWLRAHPAARVFEYGLGASTVWLARRGARVISLEHDARYADLMQPFVAGWPDVQVRVVPATPLPDGVPVDRLAGRARSRRKGHTHLDFTEYARAIRSEPGAFDLVVVDGRARVACLAEALARVRPGGLVLFDDAQRAEYQAGLQGVTQPRVCYRGLTPCLPFPSTTCLIGPIR